VHGFEPGKRGLENCRRAGLAVTDRLEELPSSAFSLITLHHVFEHLANPRKALAEIRRLLLPGGLLFVEVPNAESLRARLAWPILSRNFRVDERYRAFPIHLMYYTAATLKKILHEEGWRTNVTFTLGMGLDELIVPSKQAGGLTVADTGRVNRSSAMIRLRHILRNAFLRGGFGENVAAIAHLDG
jgi:SAM-dependent methyltransferase